MNNEEFDIKYEKECDEPKDWETNVILVRAVEDKVTRLYIEDDKEGDE